VDLETSISPFLAYEHVLGPDGQLDAEAVNQVVRFVEICVTDHSLPAFDLVHQDVLSRVVARTYEDQFRQRPAERPLLGAFWAQLRALADDAQAHARDREIAGELHLRLRMFCEERGVYARFLNRPSQLRFDAPLLTFEMERVNKDPVTRKIALAALMQAVTSRATARRRQTLFAVDEAHEYLGEDPAAETFLASCYARMRKYGMACWTISQKFETFAASRVAPVILGNSPIKLFLWQSSGHAAIGQHLGLSRRTVEQFASLDRRPGYYSDALLLSGKRSAIVRFAPHPFAYWVLTTDPTDRRLLERAAARNPHLSRLQLLHELAARYPHGAAAAGVTAASFGRAA